MKSVLRQLLFLALTGMFLTGCLLKRTTDSTRHFVLTPIPVDESAPAPSRHWSIGLGSVRMPSQLLRDSLVVRNGANEIEYLENALWAERLDHGFERILATCLAYCPRTLSIQRVGDAAR